MPDFWAWQSKFKQARWLPADFPEARRAVILRSLADVGECEVPEGSNRSPYIDECLRMAHVPESMISQGLGFWCAAVNGRWQRDCGLPVPPDYAAVVAWSKDLKKTAIPGDSILYKTAGGHHIERVIRVVPYLVTVGGNAAWGGDYTRNGEAVVVRRPNPASSSIMGYSSYGF